MGCGRKFSGMAKEDRKKSKSANDKKRVVIIIAFTIGFAMFVFAAWKLWTDMSDDIVAQTEYAQLREMISDIIMADLPAPTEELKLKDQIQDLTDNNSITSVLNIFSEMNPDFIGWIIIPNTMIDYPVVRGPNNSLYLNTMFSGVSNPAGTIFMDHLCTKGFDMPVCIIYGHNMRDGSMFAALTNYMDNGFLDDHPEIIVLTADGEKLVYRIFEAKYSDAWDSVYSLEFNDYEDEQVLILSTCLNDADRYERVLVFAVLDLPSGIP